MAQKKAFCCAARWEGIVPIHRSKGIKQPLTLDEVKEINQYIHQFRTADAPYDFYLSGVLPGKKLSEDKAMLAPYVEIGVTWWLEFVYSGTGSIQKNIDRIRFGPPG